MTRELIAWPDAHAWVWRISVAEVASSGPFSRFDGVQRWLAILSGAGVLLDFGTRSVELTNRSAPLPFNGADAVNCELLAGPVQDLNLMVRGGPGARIMGRMQRIVGRTCERTDTSKTVAIYNMAQTAVVITNGVALELPCESLIWQTLPEGTMLELEAADAIWMEIADP